MMCSITVPSTGTSHTDAVTFITRTGEKFSTDVHCTSSQTAAGKCVSHGVRHQLRAVNVHVGVSSRHRTGKKRFTLGRSESLWYTAPNNAPLMHMGDKSKKTWAWVTQSPPSFSMQVLHRDGTRVQISALGAREGQKKDQTKATLSPSCIASSPPPSHVACTTVLSASGSWSLKWFVICYYMVYGRQIKGLSPDLMFFSMKRYLHCNIGMDSGLERSWSPLLKPEAAATSPDCWLGCGITKSHCQHQWD